MGDLALVGRLPIDARRSVVLVRVAGQVYVVGVSEAGLTKLGEIAASDLPPHEEGPVPSFADAVRGAMRRGERERRGGTNGDQS
jgi:flagellar biogenesis protein FliO